VQENRNDDAGETSTLQDVTLTDKQINAHFTFKTALFWQAKKKEPTDGDDATKEWPLYCETQEDLGGQEEQ
jgi:hypothetical protein